MVHVIELLIRIRRNHAFAFLGVRILYPVMQDQCRSRVSHTECQRALADRRVGHDHQTVEVLLETFILHRIVTPVQTFQEVFAQLVGQSDLYFPSLSRTGQEGTRGHRFRIISKRRVIIEVTVVVQENPLLQAVDGQPHRLRCVANRIALIIERQYQ